MESEVKALIGKALSIGDEEDAYFADRVIAALREDYALVPKEPTAAVIEAGMASDWDMRMASQGEAVAAGYRAMIRAADLLNKAEDERC